MPLSSSSELPALPSSHTQARRNFSSQLMRRTSIVWWRTFICPE